MKLFISWVFLILFLSSSLWADESVFIYQDHGKRDPFWPLVSSAGNIINYDSDVSVTDMTLEGIMFGANGEAIAIVNGKVVKKGDRIGEFVVEVLQKNSVIFSKGTEKFELRLKKKED